MKRQYRYYAFISYSHKDEKWAKWLQRQLESYRLPSVIRKEGGGDLPARLRPVFRDATDLPAGKLRKNLYRELEESRFLIVICSPHSARPNQEGEHWVDNEVRDFRRMGREDNIIPVIVDGIPKDPARECFCPAIKELEELKGIDATKTGKRRALNDVVACILGLRPDDLWGRAERLRKRRLAINTMLGTAAALMLAAGLYYWYDVGFEKQRYFTDYVDRWGIPRGLFELRKEQIAKRNEHYRFIYLGRKGRFGERLLREVTRANSAGMPTPHENTERRERPMIQRLNYNKDNELTHIDFVDRNGKIRIQHAYSGDRKQYVTFKHIKEDGKETPMALSAKTAAVASGAFDRDDAGKSQIRCWTLTRTNDGYISAVRFEDNYENKVRDADGIFGRRYELDAHGRIKKMFYLDEKGETWMTQRGIAGRVYEYDAMGNLYKTTYVNEKGEPVLNEAGWMICIETYDANGNVTEERLLDASGNLMLHGEGYAKVICKYDERGNRIEQAYFGVDGKPILHKDGYAKFTMKYDERGNVIEQAYFGVDGNPTLHKDGYAGNTLKYDERGNKIEQAYFDVDGNPILHKDGFTKFISKYDERGNRIEQAYFGVDGNPILHKDGFAKVICKYYEHGNEIEEAYFGVDDKLTLLKDGYAKLTMKYNEHVNSIEIAYFGVDGNSTLHKDGFAKVICEYDDRGIETERAYFGVDGKPILHKDGFAKFTSKYDERGNLIEQAYLGVDGKPTLDKNGVANRLVIQYDERGNMAEITTFDVDGKMIQQKKMP